MRSEIYTEAQRWVGTPYQHQGRKCGQACDCIGLLIGVARALKFKSPPEVSIPEYSPLPSDAMCEAMAAKYLVKTVGTRIAEALPGQVGLFWFSKRGVGQHFCIFGWHDATARKTMIHAYTRGRHVIETGVSEFWEKRLISLYDFKEAANG